MEQSIIDKYNIPVPRYTSYPTANNFHVFSESEYLQAIEQSNHALHDQLSFYIHIPFCRRLCHFCGCNSFPMERPESVDEYVKALHHEIDLLLPRISKSRRISQIHYGGGSPTAIPLHHLRELNEHLFSSFATIDNPEIAIECHPGYLAEKDWEELTKYGFTRYSIGIQDFNIQVLKSVRRQPPLLPIPDIVKILRDSGARINFDFIYGLPHQSVDSFCNTIEQAIGIAPDRLVTFSYGHVPWVNKRQLLLEREGLPSQNEKINMFTHASTLLKQAGYKSIGIDHFVLPNDELNLALEQNQLHRNFQGYCPRRITAQVYAFGITGISQLEAAYAQNTKDIQQYIASIQQGQLSTAKGYSLNFNEKVTREVIETLMCNYRINWNEIADEMHLSPQEVRDATAYSYPKMQSMAADGLIEFNENGIQVTQEGKPFVRNVAASLDRLAVDSKQHFSKPI